MSVFSAIVVYFLIWWVVIFCTLPFGLQDNEAKDGSMPGAPVSPGLKKKILFTTIISAIVWLVIYSIIRFGGISFHDMAQKMAM